MTFEFDTVIITFMDPEKQDSFLYFMGYDVRDDNTNDNKYIQKLIQNTKI